MNKRKNAVLLIITIAFLLVMVVTATYAFLISNETNDYANIVIESNIAVTNGEFKTTGGNLDLNVSIANMMESQAGTLAASNNTLLNVSYKSGEVESYTCSYDIYYKWENGTDSYTISDANQKEFTYEIKDGYTVIVPETNFVASSNTTPQKLTTEKLEIDNKGNNPTMQSYNIITKYYNLAAEQKQNAGKDWKISFYVDNVVCGAVTGTVTLTNNGSTQTQNVLGSETTFALSSPVGTNISCNNSAVPSYDNGTVTISHIRGNTTCNVNSTISSAITNLDNTKNSIQMIANESGISKLNLGTGKTVTIDLNGKEIKTASLDNEPSTGSTYNSSYTIFDFSDSKLTINDSIGTGGMYTSKDSDIMAVRNNTTVMINGGTYSGRIAVYGAGSNSNITINNGTFIGKWFEAVSLTNSCTNCAFTINAGEYYSTRNNIVAYLNTSNTGIFTINNGHFYQTLLDVDNNNNGNLIYINANHRGTLNINGGSFISNAYAIATVFGSTVNINQTSTPIYIASLNDSTSTWSPAIYNQGIFNIRGSQSNACTDNYANTTSGLCIYGKTSSVVNRGEDSIMKINGGTIVNEGTGGWPATEAYLGKLYYKNASISGNRGAAGTSSNGGELYICDSVLNGNGEYDFRTLSASSSIKYSSSTTFTDGTHTPNISASHHFGPITSTPEACVW